MRVCMYGCMSSFAVNAVERLSRLRIYAAGQMGELASCLHDPRRLIEGYRRKEGEKRRYAGCRFLPIEVDAKTDEAWLPKEKTPREIRKFKSKSPKYQVQLACMCAKWEPKGSDSTRVVIKQQWEKKGEDENRQSRSLKVSKAKGMEESYPSSNNPINASSTPASAGRPFMYR